MLHVNGNVLQLPTACAVVPSATAGRPPGGRRADDRCASPSPGCGRGRAPGHLAPGAALRHTPPGEAGDSSARPTPASVPHLQWL